MERRAEIELTAVCAVDFGKHPVETLTRTFYFFFVLTGTGMVLHVDLFYSSICDMLFAPFFLGPEHTVHTQKTATNFKNFACPEGIGGGMDIVEVGVSKRPTGMKTLCLANTSPTAFFQSSLTPVTLHTVLRAPL